MDASPALLAVPDPWIKQTSASRALVLLYHRVADLDLDPQLLSVTPRHFDEHLQTLSQSYDVMTIATLVEHLEARTLPKRSVAITFDDGYKDNLFAKSQLEKFGLPATVFVTTSALDNGREFWWDELEQLFLAPGHLPERLYGSTLDGFKLHRFIGAMELGEDAFYGTDTAKTFAGWNVANDNNPTIRHQVYREVHNYLRLIATGTAEKESILQGFFDWAGRQRQIRASHQALSRQDLAELARGGLIEIGSHTTTHPVLAKLSGKEQASEIDDSRSLLQELLGLPVQSFAYPYGAACDFNSESVAIVRDCGYRAACSNIPDLVWTGTDPYQLPRVLVRDCHGDTFSQWLQGWF